MVQPLLLQMLIFMTKTIPLVFEISSTHRACVVSEIGACPLDLNSKDWLSQAKAPKLTTHGFPILVHLVCIGHRPLI